MFTYALLEALRLEGPRNCATVDRLAKRLKQRVTELGKEHGKPRQTPLVRAEPIEKRHLVLLPDKAEPCDADPLRVNALKAEVMGNLNLARQLWICVLAIIRADMDAIASLERIAIKQASLPKTTETLGSDSERTESIANASSEIVATESIHQKEAKNLTLLTFFFEVITVDEQGQKIGRETKQAEYKRETLAAGVDLEMVPIPGGTFLMGSAEGEGKDSERPQHSVTLEPFWMGKYPVTQAQWRAIASLPKIEHDLNPEPSQFAVSSRPVEQVSWIDAVEFCRRLSQKSGHEYRLPSEAEWEYACRARTTTPFHFGATLTAELANYDATATYENGPRGTYREQTTTLGSFPANAFGLYDLHGNVFEWCSDHWHESYVSAPTNGSVWLSPTKNARRIIRGGSWSYFPWYCRSASRFSDSPINRLNDVGFRVSCSTIRTL